MIVLLVSSQLAHLLRGQVLFFAWLGIDRSEVDLRLLWMIKTLRRVGNFFPLITDRESLLARNNIARKALI